jgi:hypothetical protein
VRLPAAIARSARAPALGRLQRRRSVGRSALWQLRGLRRRHRRNLGHRGVLRRAERGGRLRAVARQVLELQSHGIYQFGESGEYTLTQRTRFTRHMTVPHSCLAGTSCATYESLLESETGEADANCRDGGSSCSCDVTASLEEMLTGSYDVDDATLTLSNGDEYEFCVDGASLSLKSGALEVFLTKF